MRNPFKSANPSPTTVDLHSYRGSPNDENTWLAKELPAEAHPTAKEVLRDPY